MYDALTASVLEQAAFSLKGTALEGEEGYLTADMAIVDLTDDEILSQSQREALRLIKDCSDRATPEERFMYLLLLAEYVASENKAELEQERTNETALYKNLYGYEV